MNDPTQVPRNARPRLLDRVKTYFRRRFNPTYDDLVARKVELKEMVLFWRYPSGMIVPIEKRQRLMRDLNRIDKLLRDHPENPDRE